MRYDVRDESGTIVTRPRSAVAAHRASRRARGGVVLNRARAIRLDEEGLISASLHIAEKIRAAAGKLPPGQPVGGRLVGDPRDMGFVRYHTVRGETEHVGFRFYSVEPGRDRAFRSGKVVVGGHAEIVLGRAREIVLTLNGSMTPEEYQDARVEDDVLHLLAHEVTHAAEAKFIRKASSGDRPGEYVYDSKIVSEYARDRGIDPFEMSEDAAGEVVYYNHPAEVRAYGQQVVREALAGVSRDVRVTDRIIGRLLELRSPTWQRISLHLTERNKNRVALMVWRALSERSSGSSANRAGGGPAPSTEKFGDYTLVADSEPSPNVDVFLGDRWVGNATFVEVRGPVALKGWDVQVEPAHRRKGLASAMYRFAEKSFALPIVAGDFQTPEGQAFVGGRKKQVSVG